MTQRFTVFVALLLPILLMLAAGCAPRRPAVVPAHGVVLLDNQPLPKAVVEFVPTAEGFEGEMKATAVTDEQGRFTLKCHWQDKDGAAVGKNKVLVYEDAPPGADGSIAREAAAEAARLTKPPTLPNRPIPAKYGTVGSTPLDIEVKAGQTEYKLELTRQ